ncbi:MAG: alanine/ornithine racemase family PLP-dependent enzyme [Gammaproteobacteria bacterium]|nr:alanine/ornithine racemase family PLP-dependent enzyme [Gammaproteobacteria bacterium]MDH3432031.1 alanine/ornithine racemase family PLP-dependent enzyme [Gammaproteobacteria bacterium]
MFAPRLEIDLGKIQHNTRTLVERLAGRGISVTGVTKATLGSPEIAHAMLLAGVNDLGDSRIENIEAMRSSNVSARMSLIRSPMLSQAKRVVTSADMSFNSELEVIRRLSLEAGKLDRTHAVVLMVELGDLREGIMPVDLMAAVSEILNLPNIILKGLGTNLACRSGVSPDDANMSELSRLAALTEATFDISIEIVSGGNSANLEWVFSSEHTGRVNNLRLGESILLGCETLHRNAIDGLHTDAITLIAEVIESKVKPSRPTGELVQNAFGTCPAVADRGAITQSILAIGVQDIDLCGLQPPEGTEILSGSSDHLLVTSSFDGAAVGGEMKFQLNYSALLRAMTSPFVTKSFKSAIDVSSLRQIA